MSKSRKGGNTSVESRGIQETWDIRKRSCSRSGSSKKRARRCENVERVVFGERKEIKDRSEAAVHRLSAACVLGNRRCLRAEILTPRLPLMSAACGTTAKTQCAKTAQAALIPALVNTTHTQNRLYDFHNNNNNRVGRIYLPRRAYRRNNTSLWERDRKRRDSSRKPWPRVYNP